MEQYINQIINADCLDILKELPDKCIDLILTDPPYGIDIVDEFSKTIKSSSSMFNMSKGIVGNGQWDKNIPQKEIFDEILRVSKNQIIWGGNYFIEYLHNTRCFLVWDKMNGTNPMADCELAWTSFNSSVRKFNMHHFSKGYGIKQHPTQKPVALFSWCLEKFSKENDLILDCFSGSGTTAIACHNLKRRFICIEKDYDYWKASCERLKEHQSQLRLF